MLLRPAKILTVGPRGLEPRLNAPKALVLPLHHGPLEIYKAKKNFNLFFTYFLPMPDFKYFSLAFASLLFNEASQYISL